jgi:hypothetical protein
MPIDRNSAQYITGAIYKPTQTSAPGVWDLDDQANSIAKNLWPLPPQAVQRSLRFNSADSASLSRTPVASNRTTWTWSGWVKISVFGTYRALFARGDTYIDFNANNKIEINLRNSATNYFLITTPVYRDPSAWYHFVVTLDTNNGTAADRLRAYVNGVRVEQYDMSTYQSISAGYEPLINSAALHYIGGPDYFNGYMAEVNFVDGQALTPSSFGETDPQTGIWVPKRYTGTYGTNGFRLPFTNNTSTTALGFDASGNGNNWTPNNFSVTAGSGNDSLLDVPSLYGTDTGLGGEVRGNYATFNPLDNGGATLSDGNLVSTRSTASTVAVRSTFAVSSGKWYWEVTPTALGALTVGIGTQSASLTNIVGGDAFGYGWYNDSGGTSSKYNNNVSSAYSTALTAGTVCGVALDLDSSPTTITFYRNEISQGVAYSGLTAGTYFAMISQWGGTTSTANINFGQRPFAYAAPTGFKALCTTNLPAPAIGQTSSNQADNHFAAVTYTGNGGTQTISTLDFQPDLVWIKNRGANANHRLFDSVRGSDKVLYSSLANAEATDASGLTAFTSNGFSIGSTQVNDSGNTFVAWCWNAGGNTVTNTNGTITSQLRANQRAGFSIVTYTGNGVSYPTGATIGHGLATAPQFIITKNRNTANNWNCYHVSVATGYRIDLNSAAAATGDAGAWNSVAPTSTVFSIGNTGNTNISGAPYVAYCFAPVSGYSAFGSYTGNGSTDGPFVYTGFRPRWIMVKQSAGTSAGSGSWQIFDTARDLYNPSDYRVQANSNGVEGTGAPSWDVLSNGFKLRSLNANWNETSGTYIYAAFAETPARLSTAR